MKHWTTITLSHKSECSYLIKSASVANCSTKKKFGNLTVRYVDDSALSAQFFIMIEKKMGTLILLFYYRCVSC
jgi:hypothetical protein